MNLTALKDEIRDYIHTQVDVVKLKVASKAEKVMANSILAVALVSLGIFGLLFFSIAGAYAISSATGHMYLGFLLVGAFYVILGVLLFALRQRLLNAPIINALLKKLHYKEH